MTTNPPSMTTLPPDAGDQQRLAEKLAEHVKNGETSIALGVSPGITDGCIKFGSIAWTHRHTILTALRSAQPGQDRNDVLEEARAKLLERLGDGEFYAQGDRFELIFRPGGGSFASLDVIVAKMACGETAYWLPGLVATLLNAALKTVPAVSLAGEQDRELIERIRPEDCVKCGTNPHATELCDKCERKFLAALSSPVVGEEVDHE